MRVRRRLRMAKMCLSDEGDAVGVSDPMAAAMRANGLVRDEPDELVALLRAVERIADGVDGFKQLAVELGAGRPAPAPSTFTPAEQRALDDVEAALVDTVQRAHPDAVVLASSLATVYRLACERGERR